MPRYEVRCPKGHFLSELTIRIHIPTTVAVTSHGYCNRCALKFDKQPRREELPKAG